MADVARLAGTSKVTVSNVVNGRSGVGPATRQRVREAIEELGYEVNLAARFLRAGRTGTIGLLVPEVERPYFSQLARRLADRLDAAGYHLAIERTGVRRERELRSMAMDRLQLYDGVIISVTHLTVDDLRRIELGRPAVLIGERDVPPTFDHVMMDNVGGARRAAAHLLATGSRAVAVIGASTSPVVDVASLRTRGVLDAHREAGRTWHPDLLLKLDVFDMGDGYAATREALRRRADLDGVVALTDVVAFGVLRALADEGRRVPDDVQVVGFDDVEEAEYMVPRLSTVDPANEAMADAMVELLLRQVRGSDTPASGVVTPEPRLVLRESTR